jgi:hypothetical protein
VGTSLLRARKKDGSCCPFQVLKLRGGGVGRGRASREILTLLHVLHSGACETFPGLHKFGLTSELGSVSMLPDVAYLRTTLPGRSGRRNIPDESHSCQVSGAWHASCRVL